jgi:hypothetical protein
MNGKVSKEIQCIARLQALTGQLDDILVFLKLEGLIDDGRLKYIKQSPDQAKEVQLTLRDLQVTQKLQMLVYEWTILPVENITISLVTDRNQKEFIFTG